MSRSAPRIIAACAGLAAFAVAIFAGLAAGNDAVSILWRGVLSMGICWALGLAVGIAGTQVLRDHLRETLDDEPEPSPELFSGSSEGAELESVDADEEVIEV